jgi:hypothetical protein
MLSTKNEIEFDPKYFSFVLLATTASEVSLALRDLDTPN